MPNQTLNFRPGCYLMCFTPAERLEDIEGYDGTLRVELDQAKIIASGDLYVRKTNGRAKPKPGPQIPIFPIDDYRLYFHVTEIAPNHSVPNSVKIRFEPHRFYKSEGRFINRGTFVAELTKTTAPRDFPSGSVCFSGKVTQENVEQNSGANSVRHVGDLEIGWISSHLRTAVVEMDKVANAPFPSGNGAGLAWSDTFSEIGWEMNANESDSNLAEPDTTDTQGFWTEGELHEEMLHSRVRDTNLDNQWHYYLLAVRRITTQDRGVLFDVGGTDSNNMPREGAAVASGWPIPPIPMWGTAGGMSFGEAKAPYFRAAVHEVGHAMGLDHNFADPGFMNTTDVIAARAAAGAFPANIQWSFAPDDMKRLRHGPDICVRPGGTAWSGGNSVFPRTDSLGDAAAVLVSDKFELKVSPLRAEVPLGAPVRINFELCNKHGQPEYVPANLSMKSGFVSGTVVDPKGNAGIFWPLIKCIDEAALRPLEPGTSTRECMTLLRGPGGALFPVAGFHRVIVEISWQLEGARIFVRGETTVRITPPAEDDQFHKEIARRLLDTPDTLLSLAIGGDHLIEGNEVIKAAVHNPAYQVLRPHFAIVEAKRLATRHRTRKPDIVAACQLMDEETVLSESEAMRMMEWINKAPDKANDPVVLRAKKMLEDKLAEYSSAYAEGSGHPGLSDGLIAIGTQLGKWIGKLTETPKGTKGPKGGKGGKDDKGDKGSDAKIG